MRSKGTLLHGTTLLGEKAMTKKRSEWMEGLLQGERYVLGDGIAAAKQYGDIALYYDSPMFRRGWFDAIAHHERMADDVHPN